MLAGAVSLHCMRSCVVVFCAFLHMCISRCAWHYCELSLLRLLRLLLLLFLLLLLLLLLLRLLRLLLRLQLPNYYRLWPPLLLLTIAIATTTTTTTTTTSFQHTMSCVAPIYARRCPRHLPLPPAVHRATVQATGLASGVEKSGVRLAW